MQFYPNNLFLFSFSFRLDTVALRRSPGVQVSGPARRSQSELARRRGSDRFSESLSLTQAAVPHSGYATAPTRGLRLDSATRMPGMLVGVDPGGVGKELA